MKSGRFLVVNEPSIESVDQKLRVPAEKCDCFPAQVYVPRCNKKMEKGMFCVVASIAQITFCIVMCFFHSWVYVIPVVFEIAFFAMYAKEHVWVLTAHMLYISCTLFVITLTMVLSLLPESLGTSQDIKKYMPPLETMKVIPVGLLLAFFTILRLLLIVSYRTQLFFSNIRDKFATEKVILQPT